jgi:transcription elongation factor Elf1
MIKEVNGFKILKNLESRKNNSYVLAVCKECGKEWETAFYTLKTKKSCGCNSWKQLKPLPEFINGFRTIKCHGYDMDRGVRWATVECKVCHQEYEVDPNKLQYRKHCGCVVKGKIASKYSSSHPRLRGILKHMMARCHNPNNKDYHNYGAKGKTVCDEWRKNSDAFCKWALENGYEEHLSIERIDPEKGYSPENCKWADALEQGRNTRRVKMTIEKAREVRTKYAELPCYKTILNLSSEYGVSDASVYLIVQNKTWKE